MLKEWKMKGLQTKALNGKFRNTRQWENQEQDGRTLSGGTNHRS
jgi:hypothetical protein